jgi:hypothetical protein
MIVLDLDQRASRHSPDRITSAAEHLNSELETMLRQPFVRTTGDEMQAVLAAEQGLYPVAAFALRDHGWWLGVGLGEIDEPLGPTARDSRGPAFWAARSAVGNAKNKHKSPRGVAVVSAASRWNDVAQDLDAALNALAFIIHSRTRRQWEAVWWSERELSGADIAKKLKVTPQASSQLLRAAGAEEERRLKTLIDHLARLALQHG